MRSKKRVNEASKYMTIEQLKKIQENSYRSECLSYDYEPHSIDLMLVNKLSKQWEVDNERMLEQYNYETRG